MSSPVLIRAYASQIERTGPRQLTGRLVPYNEPTEVVDEVPNGNPDVYWEGFRLGAFTPQVSNKANFKRIGLIHSHEGGLGYLGPFVALRDQPDGLWGDAKVLPTHAENVEELLSEGIDGLSVEFRLPGDNHTEVVDGVRWRVRAHLHQVALEAKGAYPDARVMAYRSETEEQERLAAEATERAQAEAAETAKRAAAEAELAERRRRWDEMTGRLDAEKSKQERYVREYGLVRPGGYRPQT